MYPDFPFEILVPGIPVSHQTKTKTRLESWKQTVEQHARAALPEGSWATEDFLSVTIYYFPQASMTSDLDNSTKPVLDALSRCVYIDDSQIERLEIQRFEPERPEAIEGVTEQLLIATESDDPIIYIRVDTTGEGAKL